MAVKYKPDQYHSVTPYLIVNGAAKAIEFYKKAFGAAEILRMPMPDGKVAHAELKIGDSTIMLADGFPNLGAVDPLTLVRTMATARMLMPAAMVRLSAGRRSLTREAAALCFLAGANSIFVGEKLLTTPNPERDEDDQLFRDLGLRALGHARPGS